MTLPCNPFSRFWRTKRFAKWIWGTGKRWFYATLWSKWLVLAIEAVCGAFLGVAGIWGATWGWTDGSAYIWGVVIAAAAPALISLIQNLVGHAHPLDSAVDALEVQGAFMQTVGAIVDAKATRFREALPKLKPNSDKFSRITQPTEQLKVIGVALSGFIKNNFGLNDDELDITILKRKPGGKWHFLYKLQAQWRHAEPPDELEENSAAAICLKTGEPAFFPDKFTANQKGLYILCRRDKDRVSGSIFVFPARFSIPVGASEYVVSIVTYRKQLCAEYESQTIIDITYSFLREACRRFEIELCLDTIRTCI